MYSDRIEIYRKIEESFNTNIITYITSDRINLEAQIGTDVIDYFIRHLDKIGPCKSISLYLYTRGGNTSAARNIVNLLKMFCDELRVIIPHKAHSAGTIISIGAKEIIMTKQATLGPIDPSLKSPLNPTLPDGTIIPVSVEAVNGYLEFVKNELGNKNSDSMVDILKSLSNYVHPLVLGEVYRSKSQIKMIADELLDDDIYDKDSKQKIIDFLCSDSGSHDYTINRKEAEKSLGLKVTKPTDEQYKLIKALYDDISEELQLNNPFHPQEITGAYSGRRCLLESIIGGSDYFVTEGAIIHGSLPGGQPTIINQINYDGWRHELNTEQRSIEISKETEVYYEHRSNDQT